MIYESKCLRMHSLTNMHFRQKNRGYRFVLAINRSLMWLVLMAGCKVHWNSSESLPLACVRKTVKYGKDSVAIWGVVSAASPVQLLAYKGLSMLKSTIRLLGSMTFHTPNLGSPTSYLHAGQRFLSQYERSQIPFEWWMGWCYGLTTSKFRSKRYRKVWTIIRDRARWRIKMNSGNYWKTH